MVINYDFTGLEVWKLDWYTEPGFYIHIDNHKPIGPFITRNFALEVYKLITT